MYTQQDQSIFQGNYQEGARMSVFTPRKHNTTIIRPHVFNFNESMVGELLESRGDAAIVSTFQGGNGALRHAIVPDSNGVMLDTYNFDSYWSFILIVDVAATALIDTTYGGPRNRTVLTGYFIDEPFLPHTLMSANPVPNLGAGILFTQKSMIALQNISGPNSRVISTIGANIDLIPQAMSVLVPEGDQMLLTDTGSIAKNTSFDQNGNERYLNKGPSYINNFTKAHANPRMLNSPRHQLIGLVNAIHDGMIQAEHECDNSVSVGMGYDQDIPYKFQDYVTRQTHVHNGLGVTIGSGQVDPCVPQTFGELSNQWPDLSVDPCHIPSVPQYDVSGQEDISVRNTMSSLITSVITGLATEHKLASIAFRYTTFTPNQVVNATQGQWAIEGATPIVFTTEVDFGREIDMFRMNLESSLFPTVMDLGGHFDLMVSFDMANSTLVDLHYLDDVDNVNAFYEHHNRLGGLAAPNIGNDAIYNRNTDQYTVLLGDLSANITGPTSFGGQAEQGRIFAEPQEMQQHQYTPQGVR